jgi:hypothetical protein
MMKNTIILLSVFFSIHCFSQDKAFINSLTPIYPGCEKSSDLQKCFRLHVGNLVLAELKKSDVQLTEGKILIEIHLRIEKTGKATILQSKMGTPEIEKITRAAIAKMPLVDPLKNANNENTTSSLAFYVVLVKNKKTHLYELLEN